jgi:hypothetical protein
MLKAAVEGYLARCEPEPMKLRDGLRQERVLPRVPQRGRGRHNQPARVALGVLGHLRELAHIPELVRFAELALADRPRVRVS